MTKNLRYFQGKYLQGNISEERASAILSLLSDYSVVPVLKHIITDVPPFMVSDIKRSAEEYVSLHSSLQGYEPPQLDLGVGTLRDAQTLGVAFLYYAGSALLGDEVGLGKTVQIAALCNLLEKEYKKSNKTFRFCFLTEKSSVEQIRDKLIQFTGRYVGLLESGEKRVVERYLRLNSDHRHYSIVGCHSLLTSPDFLLHTAKHPFDLIVFDESKALKSSKSQIYRDCKELFSFHNRKILLNATPIELGVEDMFNQLDLLDKDFMPTKTEFMRRFSNFKSTPFKKGYFGFKNADEFRDLVKLRYLARTREDLGATYTGNEHKVLLVPLSPEQKELNKKTTLHQAVVDYPTLVDRNVPFNEQSTPKLAALLSVLAEKVTHDQGQALVYCRFVEAQSEICSILNSKGYRAVVLNGKSSAKDRAEVISAVNDGKFNVLITNVLRGIDLRSCDSCILYTIDPNPQNMVQFEGRMTRDFDIEYKALYLLVAMGREKKFVENTLKLRVTTSSAFAKSSKSLALDAINTSSNKELFNAPPTTELVED